MYPAYSPNPGRSGAQIEALAAAVIELRLDDMEVIMEGAVVVDGTDVPVEELLRSRTVKLRVRKRTAQAPTDCGQDVYL